MKRLLLALLLIVALVFAPEVSASPAATHGVWPMDGATGREFTELAHDWDPGHRGLDIEGRPGSVVRTALAGTLSFAGSVGGKPVVVVTHGDVRTTYEPVTATLPVGTRVSTGAPIGILAEGAPECGHAGLHWGLKRGEKYLNPRLLIAPTRARLVPWDYVRHPPREASRTPAPTTTLTLQAGPITSQFGYRMDPVTGAPNLHTGTDLGLRCGTPINPVAAGTVTTAGWSTLGYGNLVEIDHGTIDGRRVTSRYGHAESITAVIGQRVAASDTVSLVGSTGHSTACHLHVELLINGTYVDPLAHLSRR